MDDNLSEINGSPMALEKALKDRTELRYKTNSAFLLISVTLFSIVISLSRIPGSPGDPEYLISANTGNHLFLQAAIVLNSLSILLLASTFLAELRSFDRRVDILYKEIAQNPIASYRDATGLRKIHHAKGEMNLYTFPAFFVYAQKFSYWMFFLMVILYTVYALAK